MELNISRSELKAAVTGLSRIIPNKPNLPILGGIRFEADETGTVRASATDLDQQASYRFVNTTSVDVGTFVLPLTAMKDLTKGANHEHVCLATMPDMQVQVTNHVDGHGISFTVNALNPEEWPAMHDSVTHKPADGFLDTYRRLLPFCSTDVTRFALTNVFIDVNGKGDHPVCMVTTDGRRLSVWNSMCFDLKHSVVVPSSRFLAWSGLSGKVEIGSREEVTPKHGKEPEVRKAWFGVSVGSWDYVTREPDVSFPAWRQVIPNYIDKVQRCCFSDKDAEALRKILPTFPGHDGNTGTIVLVGQNGRLSIAGRDDDATKETSMQLEGGSTYEGKGGQIGLNRSYLLDALAAGFRTFSYVDEMTPLKSEDGRGGTHVIMPVRTLREMSKPKPVEPVAAVNNVPTIVAGETKENDMPEKEELSSLDRLQAAYEVAKQRIRDANSALVDVATLIKDVVREDKQRRTEVDVVRAGLAKLQAIKV